MITITLPARFTRDWLNAISPEFVENEDVLVVRENKRDITITATPEALQDLANRADYYRFSRGELDPEYMGLMKSGEAVIRHLAKIGVKPLWKKSA